MQCGSTSPKDSITIWEIHQSYQKFTFNLKLVKRQNLYYSMKSLAHICSSIINTMFSVTMSPCSVSMKLWICDAASPWSQTPSQTHSDLKTKEYCIS